MERMPGLLAGVGRDGGGAAELSVTDFGMVDGGSVSLYVGGLSAARYPTAQIHSH